MPEYLAPGVYVEEIEMGAKSIEGVGTSTAGFLGVAERGPLTPQLITGAERYFRLFGGHVFKINKGPANSYLPYAVEGFFSNGGKRCFVGRIIGKGAETAKLELGSGPTENLESNTEDLGDPTKKKGGSTPPPPPPNKDLPVLRIEAIGPGTWGNRVKVQVSEASQYDATEEKRKNLFKLTVLYWDKDPQKDDLPHLVESYDNLSPEPSNSDYYGKRINNRSVLITTKRLNDGIPAWQTNSKSQSLQGGTDGERIGLSDYRGGPLPTDPSRRTGLTGFRDIDEIAILCAPNENDSNVEGLTRALIDHCENMKDRFAILQAKQASPSPGDLRPPKNSDSKYAAFYYPWIKMMDPATNMPKLVPPGGHIAGIYARTDTERGVHKAPANEVVRNCVGLQIPVAKGEQEILNPRGVNCIRNFTGRGIRVWGARTVSSDPNWKYLNVRRLFLFLEESIDEGTQWVVFEPNDQRLWARVRQTITDFLTRVWRDGALMGTTADEAFFVKCDETTMTQDDIDNGRLICLIGVAPVKPAEFVIFRIAQVKSGAEITEI